MAHVLDIGRRLAQVGALRERALGHEVVFEITSRGRSALAPHHQLALEPRGVQRMARQILEPSWSGGDWHPSRRRSVTSEILSALLASGGALSLTDDFAENTRYAVRFRYRLAVRVLRDHEYLRPADGADDRYAMDGEGCWALGVRILPDRLLGMVTDLQRAATTPAEADACPPRRGDRRRGGRAPGARPAYRPDLRSSSSASASTSADTSTGESGDVVLSPNLLGGRGHRATGPPAPRGHWPRDGGPERRHGPRDVPAGGFSVGWARRRLTSRSS